MAEQIRALAGFITPSPSASSACRPLLSAPSKVSRSGIAAPAGAGRCNDVDITGAGDNLQMREMRLHQFTQLQIGLPDRQ